MFQPLSFIVIGWLFSADVAASRPAVRTLGSRAIRFAVALIVNRHRQADRRRNRWLKERPVTSQSLGWSPPACCAAAIPEPGSADAALKISLASPARPGPRRKSFHTS